MRSRRGFTLVEVLLAIGLLVMLTSLALPVALTNTTAARATTAERILKLAPDTARGEAQRRGRPVALVLLPSEDGTELRLSLVRQPDPQGDNAKDQAADPENVSTWPTVDQGRLMPAGTTLWAGELDELDETPKPYNFAANEGFLLERALAGGDPAASVPDPVVLAWFLSDGSALAGEAAGVRLADGRVLRVRVEALTGRVVFTAPPEPEADLVDGASRGNGAGTAEVQEEALPPPSEADPASETAEGRTVEKLEFDQLEFEPLEFDQVEFDDLSEGFDRAGGDDTLGRSPADDPAAGREPDSPVRTTPQPPQPR